MLSILKPALNYNGITITMEKDSCHADLKIELNKLISYSLVEKCEEGFMDGNGVFVNRAMAEVIAIDAKQVRDGYSPKGFIRSNEMRY